MDSSTGWNIENNSSSTAAKSFTRKSHAHSVRHRLLRLLLRRRTEPDLRIQFRRCRRRLEAISDTIDPRQKDQTHTALLALNDVWNLGENQELQLSGFFRTYNLSLYSDFGDGLIRQSEFRTVTGSSAAYKKIFSKKFTLLPEPTTSARRRAATIWIITTSTIPPTRLTTDRSRRSTEITSPSLQ